MKELVADIFQRTFERCRMPITNGQFYTWMHNITVNLVMFANKLEISYIPQWQS
jgi:hypothetical protein